MPGLDSKGFARCTPPGACRPRPAAQWTGRQELVQDHQEYWAVLPPSGRKQIGLKVQFDLGKWLHSKPSSEGLKRIHGSGRNKPPPQKFVGFSASSFTFIEGPCLGFECPNSMFLVGYPRPFISGTVRITECPNTFSTAVLFRR